MSEPITTSRLSSSTFPSNPTAVSTHRSLFAMVLSCLFLMFSHPLLAQFGQRRGYRATSPLNGFSMGSGLVGSVSFPYVLFSLLIGVAFGAFFSQRFKKYRRYIFFAILVLIAVPILFFGAPIAYTGWWTVGFVIAWLLLRDPKAEAQAQKAARPTTFGSSRLADDDDIAQMEQDGLLGKGGLFIGRFRDRDGYKSLFYKGAGHLLTFAPTRKGKGTSAVIPAGLTYEGSMLFVDPKGEIARTTYYRRGPGNPERGIPGMQQAIHILDPWGITGLPVSCFNPIDWLKPDDPNLEENSMMLADSIVVPRSGGSSEFFDSESKALANGILLHVAIDPSEEGNRTLGRFRDIIVLSSSEFRGVLEHMFESPNPVVRSTAARHAGKDPELASNVLSSLQSHTHFLDSPRLRESLSRSDFRFEDMKHNPTTVYLVLPADRLDTFGRWLRLLIQQAITMNARNIEQKPKKPLLFLLDEIAALGKLSMLQQAFGLMAGFGMQIWGIVQDASQLSTLYGDGWETFIGNSGVLQYLGSRDLKTSEYFSKLCGMTTIVKTSISRSVARVFGQGGGGSSTTDTTNTDHIQRPLFFPDELMVMRRNEALLLLESQYPIAGKRITWFKDPALRQLGIDLDAEPNILPERPASAD